MQDLVARGLVVQTAPGNVPQEKRYLDEMPGVPSKTCGPTSSLYRQERGRRWAIRPRSQRRSSSE